ncbi:MAG TPA: archaetidylserine decarboxylase [Longimicrobiaceae bacterium]|nr:archaetidylserine decarboxylase [Longimicrobiaceae bacterium]
MPTIPDVPPEVPGPTWRLLLRLLGRLPARGMSRSFGRIADLPLPRAMRRPVLASFARAVGIDLGEVEMPLEEYPTLNAFFVRRLRPGARSWPEDPRALVSPVDGIVGRSGAIRDGTAVQAKGHHYRIGDFLAAEGEEIRFRNGRFLTIYLSPRHYHRIHAPAPGRLPRATYVPGHLYPVNAPAVMHIPRLFSRNERLVCLLDTARGRVAVVAVGAYNVGRISTAFDPLWSGKGGETWVTNRSRPPHLHRAYAPPIEIGAGEEILAFHLGSTVVLLFEAGVDLRPDLHPGLELRVGEQIARGA